MKKNEIGDGVESGVMEVETVVEETGAAPLKSLPLKMEAGGTSTTIERGEKKTDVPPSIPSVDVAAAPNKKPKIEPPSAETVSDQTQKKEEPAIVPSLPP